MSDLRFHKKFYPLSSLLNSRTSFRRLENAFRYALHHNLDHLKPQSPEISAGFLVGYRALHSAHLVTASHVFLAFLNPNYWRQAQLTQRLLLWKDSGENSQQWFFLSSSPTLSTLPLTLFLYIFKSSRIDLKANLSHSHLFSVTELSDPYHLLLLISAPTESFTKSFTKSFTPPLSHSIRYTHNAMAPLWTRPSKPAQYHASLKTRVQGTYIQRPNTKPEISFLTPPPTPPSGSQFNPTSSSASLVAAVYSPILESSPLRATPTHLRLRHPSKCMVSPQTTPRLNSEYLNETRVPTVDILGAFSESAIGKSMSISTNAGGGSFFFCINATNKHKLRRQDEWWNAMCVYRDTASRQERLDWA
ncbi:uncharacterized protein BDR25DRAFT_355714 [Lindgomyces ingoldianus]|uniref:Uncharacterized protein n=1 Tax=Lindgomyces ingoldianus TaxID=673940 RepID=A0ACB6QTZ0_9PLEO|nr:uncharacterized protein BDR25DRAFT_355714 [Lindgomyces ingoldianus]KAF2469990.1 hypothetical protein BDR25DRAFT_355714 [Lindgomyces ingoldianus]